MENSRNLREKERRLIAKLISDGNMEQIVDEGWPQWRVVELKDGGMGSLRFLGVVGGKPLKNAGELEFLDSDGVMVSVALLTNQNGQPAELDVFKADFSAVIALPSFDVP